ncbi:MAG TPA: PDZ domain-containing protein [Gemmatimonadota bacterium]|nr:PDZ domain-containing protein [Gemmatimonadota bacterium]
MLRTSILALAVLLGAGAARAQVAVTDDTIRYSIGWDNPASQLYAVRVTAAADGEPVMFSLPAWRPGRYILQNYAANVQGVRAEGPDGRPLEVEWLDLDSWRVEPDGARTVTLVYDYYAVTFDAGSSTLRPEVAYFNPVNLFPWVEDRLDHPVTLTIGAPAGWAVATQLAPAVGGNERVFVAPDYHRLADSPTIAAPELTDWEFEVDGVPYHAVFRGRLDLGPRTQEQVVADLAALSREEVAIFGSTPFEEYWHLYQLVPYPFGHAVEHEASASYVLSDNLFQTDEGYVGFLSVTAHELFHAWNVKRIRPAALWPYDYSAPQLTRLHWVTEGVTAYYDMLVLARAGLIPPEAYYESVAGNIQALQSSPGRKTTSASLASLTSWFSGYGSGNPNQSISFYTKGALLGLLLDLRIRDATDGERSLDDVLRWLWEEYYLEDRGYPEDGFQAAVEAVAGRSFEEFFARYVHGTEELPYDSTLAIVGLGAREEADPARPASTLGLRTGTEDGKLVVTNVLPASPALEAGLMRDDVLVAIGGDPVGAAEEVQQALAERAPGEAVEITIERQGERQTVSATLAGGGNLRWRVVPVANPTERQVRLRDAWLASAAAAPREGSRTRTGSVATAFPSR